MVQVDSTLQRNHASRLMQFAVNVAAEAMFTVSPDGRILDANHTACERLEYTHDELLGMTVADIDPNYPAELWPGHFAELRQVGKMTFDTRHRSKSGRIFDVEVSVAYFEFDGYEYCCSFVRDITQRKQAEHILRLQHAVLARVASTVGILSETLDFLCKQVEEMLPGAIASVMLIDPKDGCLRFEAGPALTAEVRAALEPLAPGAEAGSCGSAAYLKKPVIVEDTRCSRHWSSLKHIVDEFKLLACWSLPILDEHHQTLGTFAISHQFVTKPTDFHRQVLETATHMASLAIRRKRFEEQLQFAHEELAHVSRLNTMGEMASGLAHELNQPLAAIANHAFLLEHHAGNHEGDASFLEHSEAIREQALRAGAIITGVRNMARKVAPSRECMCLNSLVNKSLVMLEPELRQMGVSLFKDLSEGLPSTKVDGVQIQQILINLVRNAIDAMKDSDREDRSMTISTTRLPSSEVALRVSDSGPGLTESELESVFSPFQTTKDGGMGMGLAICRSIADAHSGRLVAENGYSKGASFCLTLPISCEKG